MHKEDEEHERAAMKANKAKTVMRRDPNCERLVLSRINPKVAVGLGLG